MVEQLIGDDMAGHVEKCRNPWNKDCKGSDIEVYILFKGDKLPICRNCWDKISEENLEW